MRRQYSYLPLQSPFGPVAIIWSVFEERPRIERVLIAGKKMPAPRGAGTPYPGARRGSCAEIDDTACRISAFLGGEAVRFPLEIARLDLCSHFQRSVLLAEYGIPRGRVSTYGMIADHVGKSGAARAVGSALANNPFPILIPCHRAVRSDGTPGGYQGGGAMKRALLEMEGVPFDEDGRVCMGKDVKWSF